MHCKGGTLVAARENCCRLLLQLLLGAGCPLLLALGLLQRLDHPLLLRVPRWPPVLRAKAALAETLCATSGSRSG